MDLSDKMLAYFANTAVLIITCTLIIGRLIVVSNSSEYSYIFRKADNSETPYSRNRLIGASY